MYLCTFDYRKIVETLRWESEFQYNEMVTKIQPISLGLKIFQTRNQKYHKKRIGSTFVVVFKYGSVWQC